MLKITLLSLGLFISTFFGHAAAEGNCPPGQFPIGGQGAVACAPMPQSGSATPQESRPLGKWIKTWERLLLALLIPLLFMEFQQARHQNQKQSDNLWSAARNLGQTTAVSL